MDQVRCRVQNMEKLHDDLLLHDGVSVSLGRGPATKIKDTKCSRKQVELTANYQDRNVTIKQFGPNTGLVNGKELSQNQTTFLANGESFSLIGSQYNYTVSFDGEAKPTTSKATKHKLPVEEASRKKPKVEDPEDEHVNEVKAKLEEMRKSRAKNSHPPTSPIKMDTSTTSEPVSTSSWRVTESFLIYNPQGLVHRDKVASFDIDGTII